MEAKSGNYRNIGDVLLKVPSMIAFRRAQRRLVPLQRLIHPTSIPGVVLASYGRSGSTMLYRAIGDGMSLRRFGRARQMVFDVSWTLAEKPPKRGTVCKTHDYPQALQGRKDLKSVFVFGSPTEAVRSVILQRQTQGIEWVQQHLEHLKSTGRFEDIKTSDVLGIGPQLDAWTQFTDSPVLCIRYEALWREIDRLQEFTGLHIELPKQRARESKILAEDNEVYIKATYANLERRVASLPDVFEPAELHQTSKR